MSELVRQWIDCNSPLLLVAKEHLSAWQGIDVPSNGRKVVAQFRSNRGGPATDYDRACDVDDYVGVIDVGNGKGIVLGDEPLMTTSEPVSDGGLLIRWVYAESENELIAAVDKLPAEAYEDSGISFIVDGPSLVLFAASEPGDVQIFSRIEINISPGYYRVSTGKYEDDKTSFISHRLRRVL